MEIISVSAYTLRKRFSIIFVEPSLGNEQQEVFLKKKPEKQKKERSKTIKSSPTIVVIAINPRSNQKKDCVPVGATLYPELNNAATGLPGLIHQLELHHRLV